MSQPGKPTAGVLQIPIAATQKPAAAPAKKAHKPPSPRLKLLIRRLPPGLTQTELEDALGPEWKAGAGKVDWLQYKPGKVSKDPAKPSRPSRAYIHVMSSDHIAPLSDQVRQASFQDARATSHDPILLGPPSLEFAPYAKTPGHRARKDARQGTIDQDPDFIAFLESLTQPITKPAIVDTIESEEKKETVAMTPLVQFIKDKKASKAKDSSTSKSSKGRSEKDSKEKVQAKKLLQRERSDKDSGASPASEKKGKGEKTTKESAKAAKQAAAATTTSKSTKSSGSSANKESTAPEKKRERGNIAAATKILQRDLGIAPSGGRRRGKGANETASPKNESSRDSSAPAVESKKESPAKPSKNAANKAKEKEKETTNNKQPENSTPSTNKPAKAPKNNAKPKPADTPASTSTQAFLKHANPSQGVTEALLETAFGAFGAVTKVEIDKKKGFGYVDFTTPEGLQKAIAASPVTVAQSQVVVLERKANPGGEKTRKGRGDAPAAPKAKTGEGSGAGGAANANATGSTARGSRGGRGSRNKGSKGGAGGAGNSEKAQEKTEKTEKNGSAEK